MVLGKQVDERNNQKGFSDTTGSCGGLREYNGRDQAAADIV